MNRDFNTAVFAAATMMLVAIGGCESVQKTAPLSTKAGAGAVAPLKLDQPDDPDADTDGDGTAPGIADIASQFEKDLADFERMQAGTRSRSGESTGSDGVGEPFPRVPHQSSKPLVAFDDAAATASGAQSTAANGSGEIAATSTPIDWRTQPFADEPLPPPAASPAHAERGGNGPPVQPLTTTDRFDAPEVRMREAMVNLRRELYQDASYANQPLRQYLTMAALTLIDSERAIDPDAFPDLRDREREILRAYQSFFTALGRELQSNGEEAKLVDLIDQLRSALIDEPPLAISRAELCTRVQGFGAFDPFDKNVFLAGTPQQVVIYTEIEHFTSELNDSHEWVTDLWQELVIYNSHDNVPVWHQEWQPAPDRSARKRTDFFISCLVTLPERLTVGQYTLKVRVRDETSDLITETGIPFQIVADPKMTARIPD